MLVQIEMDLYMIHKGVYKGVKGTYSVKIFQIPKWLKFELFRKFQINNFLVGKHSYYRKITQLFTDNVLTHQSPNDIKLCYIQEKCLPIIVTLIKIRHIDVDQINHIYLGKQPEHFRPIGEYVA